MIRNDKLIIFENFEIDEDLPKYANKSENKDSVQTPQVGNKIFFSNTDDDADEPASTFSSTGTTWVIGNQINDSEEKPKKRSLLHRIFCNDEVIKPKQVLVMDDLKNFFVSCFDSFKELNYVGDVIENIEEYINNARATNQVAMLEKLIEMKDVIRGELNLITINVNKYLTEKDIVKYYQTLNDTEKQLKLTWIKNFIKPIPTDLVSLKKEIDKRLVFDNYVILHFDPNNDATNLTKKEEEILKDPILFGVIKNSRKLYYIGDWKDDYCKLTLEELLTSIKRKKASEINNNTVNKIIDSI